MNQGRHDEMCGFERLENSPPMKWLRALSPIWGVLSLVGIGFAVVQLNLALSTAERETKLAQTRMLAEVQQLANENPAGMSQAIRRYLEQLVEQGVRISHLDLKKVDLDEASLANGHFTDVEFGDVEDASFREATLDEVVFTNSVVPNLENAKLVEAYFENASANSKSSLAGAEVRQLSFAVAKGEPLPDLEHLQRKGAAITYVRILAQEKQDEVVDALSAWSKKFCEGVSDGLQASFLQKANVAFLSPSFIPGSISLFRCEKT